MPETTHDKGDAARSDRSPSEPPGVPTDPSRAPGPAEGEVVEEEHSPLALVTRFFLVPFLIIVASVGIFLLAFHLLTSEKRTASDYLQEVSSGHFNRRWQAAFELSRHLAIDPPRDREAFAREMVAVLEDTADDDPRVRRYLVTALGQLGSPAAVPALIESLDDPDDETRFQAVLALGEIGDERAVDPLAARLESSRDPGIRIAAAGMLGALGDRRAVPALERALRDSREDVRWNAALALSRLGKLSAVDQLRRMLDREYLARVPEATPAQQEAALLEAIRALVRLDAREARDELRRLAAGDPSPAVRMQAREALETLGG